MSSVWSSESNRKRSDTMKLFWTPERRARQRENLRKYWSGATQRKKQQSECMKKHNPMDNPEARSKWQNFIDTTDWHWNSSKVMREKLRLSWKNAERHEIHSARMRGASEVQRKMQANGNQLRRGLPNLGAKDWWDSLSKEERNKRAENISEKLVERFDGITRYPRGIWGWLDTKWGVIRYDSTWEKEFILAMGRRKEITRLTRDIPIPYRYNGRRHYFRLDFRVEIKKQSPVLVEVKCPYYLDTDVSRAKVRAARRYAKENDMRFVLIASKEKAKEGWECLTY